MQSHIGQLHKMSVTLAKPIQYKLDLDVSIDMNALIGREIKLSWYGGIQCISCGKPTKKSFSQGFCYTCYLKAPEAADCILRPELCRAHLGEGRDIEWENRNHNQPHFVYFAASDVVKVGVTRSTQIPTRWIDQGASSAIKIAETPNRYYAGVLEVALKDYFTDKTNWRNMLQNKQDESIDLVEEKWRLEEILPADLMAFFTEDDEIETLHFPVETYPTSVKSVGFDKENTIEGKLMGIKGQYLIFENGAVLNIRKHTGYIVELSFD